MLISHATCRPRSTPSLPPQGSTPLDLDKVYICPRIGATTTINHKPSPAPLPETPDPITPSSAPKAMQLYCPPCSPTATCANPDSSHLHPVSPAAPLDSWLLVGWEGQYLPNQRLVPPHAIRYMAITRGGAPEQRCYRRILSAYVVVEGSHLDPPLQLSPECLGPMIQCGSSQEQLGR